LFGRTEVHRRDGREDEDNFRIALRETQQRIIARAGHLSENASRTPPPRAQAGTPCHS